MLAKGTGGVQVDTRGGQRVFGYELLEQMVGNSGRGGWGLGESNAHSPGPQGSQTKKPQKCLGWGGSGLGTPSQSLLQPLRDPGCSGAGAAGAGTGLHVWGEPGHHQAFRSQRSVTCFPGRSGQKVA